MNQTSENAIRRARLRRKLTQQQLAAAVGVTKGAVSQWEQGATRPEPTTAVKLAGLLPGLSLEKIYSAGAAG